METPHREIEKLLNAYFDDKTRLDDLTVQIIQGWLEERLSQEDGGPDKPYRGEVDAELRRIFVRTLSEKKPATDNYTRESLARLHNELGFTDRRRPRTVVPLNRRPSAGKRTVRLALVGCAAAAVIFATLVVPGLFSTRSGQPEPTAPAMVAENAAPHETKEIILPDGSTVRLRSGTHISYTEGFEQGRTISIDGEAFFTVKRDEEHPFTVEAEDMTVTVLGTEFNLKAWSGEQSAEVVLASGSVEVQAGENVRRLTPGQQATIDRTTDVINVTHIGKEDISRVKGINLSFYDVTLAEALDMIADFYGVEIETVGNVPEVDGIVVKMEDGASLEQTLLMLQLISPVFDYGIEEGRITITKK